MKMSEKRFWLDEYGVIHDNEYEFNLLGEDDLVDRINELQEEKEFWKNNSYSQDSFNHILMEELNTAQEQGYEVTDPFRKLIQIEEIKIKNNKYKFTIENNEPIIYTLNDNGEIIQGYEVITMLKDLNEEIGLLSEFITAKGYSINDFNEWLKEKNEEGVMG